MSQQHQELEEQQGAHRAPIGTNIPPPAYILKDNCNDETKIAILISIDSSFQDSVSSTKNNETTNDHNSSMAVVLWVCTSDTASVGTKKKKTLTYYHYQDHPRQFNHTDALLQRLHPINEIQISRIGSTASSSSKKKKKNDDSAGGDENLSCPLTKILQRFKTFLEEKCSNASSNQFISSSDAAGCPLETVVVTNTEIAFLKGTEQQTDLNRLTTIVQQLLGVDNGSVTNTSEGVNESTSIVESKASLLQFTGNTYLQQHPVVAKGLQFYLYAIENCFPNVIDDSLIGSYRSIGIHGRLDSFLMLDSTAADAIHLWPPCNSGQWTVTGGTANNNSIAGIITSNACTAMGKRLLQQWLKQPLINLSELQQRQNAVTELVKNSVGHDNLRSNGLKLFSSSSYDLSKLAVSLKKYEHYISSNENEEDVALSNVNGDTSYEDQSNANGYGDGRTKLSSSGSIRKALLTLYNLNLVSTEKIPNLVEHLESLVLDADKPCHSNLLVKDCYEQLALCKQELHGSIKLCHAVLDMDMAPKDFFVKRTYKDELNDIYDEFESLQKEFDQCHQAMNETWAEISGSNATSNQVRLECCNNENYGPELKYQFRLPERNDAKILETCPAVRIHRILKNGVYFTNKALRQLSTTKLKLLHEYDMHQKEIVYQAMEIAATYTTVLYRANQAIALLDALTSLAHLASHSKNGYCCPILTDSNDDGVGIELIKARHPCVELQENSNLSDDFIPNDIKLTFGESSFLLVTGPNMGGKSTYIRSLGAIVTMAQIGSYVPCQYAKINICHHILARVGAGDLQERGISTFMAEMLESSSILRTATKRSLIIIDELGRGTSTFDGYGLARAISEYIIQKIGCMTIFATHFHELTALEDTERSVKNCHVTAQRGINGLTFLYEVKSGPCLESFGIQVAEMANVPAVVIRDAKRKARELENFEYRTKKKNALLEQKDDGKDQKEDICISNHQLAEETSSAMAWLNRFKRLPILDILNKNVTDDEKRSALQDLLVL